MSRFTSANQVLVTFTKEHLTGHYAGMVSKAHVVANSMKSARATARDLRDNPVQAGEFSEELFRVRDVKIVRFTKAITL